MDAERDPYDELTALFMTDAGDDAAFGKAEPGMDFELVGGGDPLDVDGNDAEAPLPMRVTVAMCGHLPVMAGLWVTQYADRVAEACGATALLRLEGGRCSLELFRTPSDKARVGQGASMAESVKTVASQVRRWIVCVDERDAAETVRGGADEIVILTGADKPAVLAAYGLAKVAASKLPAEHPLDVGMVVVGADESRSKAVGEVLATVADEYLDHDLEVIESIQRMDVIGDARRMLFRESERMSPADAMAMLEKAREDDVVETEADSAPAPDSSGEFKLRYVRGDAAHDEAACIPVEPVEPARVDLHREGRSVPSVQLVIEESDRERGARSGFEAMDILDLELVTGIDQADDPSTAFELAAPGDVREPETEAEAETEHSSTVEDAGRLVSHFPDLRPQPYHCPLASSIEVALDEAGRIHLLCDESELDSVRVASAWARANGELIRLATPGLAEGLVDPVIDVVTRNAALVSDLHYSGVRLHLLSSLNVDGTVRWIRAELNTEETSQIPG